MLKIQSYWHFDKVKYFLLKFRVSGIQYQVMSVSDAVQVFIWCDPSQSTCDKNQKKLALSQGFSAPSLTQTALGPGLTMICIIANTQCFCGHCCLSAIFPWGGFHAIENVVLMDFIDCPKLSWQNTTNFWICQSILKHK